MAKTEVILTSNIVGLGAESDQVKVAAGYARNYLYPQGLAIPQTAANKRRLESLRQRRAEREAHELNTMTELAASLSKMLIKLSVKTGSDGKMFGAVTAGTLTDELKSHYEIHLDKKKIHLEQPIRTLGEHEVELRLHPNVNSKLKVVIESSNPPEIPELGADARGGKGGEGRPQRGGREGRESRGGDKPEAAKDARPARAPKTDKK